MNVRLGEGWVDSFLECYTNQSLSTHPSPNPTQMTVGLEQGWVNSQYDSILECYINPSLSTHPFPYPTQMNVGLEQGWVDSFLECYTNPSLSTQPSSYSTQMNVGLGEGGWVVSQNVIVIQVLNSFYLLNRFICWLLLQFLIVFNTFCCKFLQFLTLQSHLT